MRSLWLKMASEGHLEMEEWSMWTVPRSGYLDSRMMSPVSGTGFISQNGCRTFRLCIMDSSKASPLVKTPVCGPPKL